MTEPAAPTDRRDTLISRREVREMFAAAAPRYDLLNRMLSAGIDKRWRREAVRRLGLGAGDLLIDVCGGTGDLALAGLRATPGVQALVVDFSPPMLQRAARKGAGTRLALAAGDGMRLPIRSSVAAAVVIGFGIRNIPDRRAALRECHRVLRPGGRLGVLEFSLPPTPVVRTLYLFYLRRILPRLAGLVSPAAGAYHYLADSILAFPDRRQFASLLAEAGFRDTGWRDLSLGIATLHEGRK